MYASHPHIRAVDSNPLELALLPAPADDPPRGSREWLRLHFARLNVFMDIPLVLRRFNREQCWEIVCDAVTDVPVKGGRG